MIDSWRDVFDDGFGRDEKHKARNFASMALEARNATSHLTLPLQDDEALRYLDAMHQLAAAGRRRRTAEVAELKRLYDEQRQRGLASRSPTAGSSSRAARARSSIGRAGRRRR